MIIDLEDRQFDKNIKALKEQHKALMDQQNPHVIAFAIETICSVLERITEYDEFKAALGMINMGFGVRLASVANEVDNSIARRKAH